MFPFCNLVALYIGYFIEVLGFLCLSIFLIVKMGDYFINMTGTFKTFMHVGRAWWIMKKWKDDTEGGNIYPKNEREWKAMCLDLLSSRTMTDISCGNPIHNYSRTVSPELTERLKEEIAERYGWSEYKPNG
jgi:hypothetical protein